MLAITCSHCKKQGHEVKACYEIVGYLEGWPNNVKGADHGVRSVAGAGMVPPMPMSWLSRGLLYPLRPP